MYVSSWCRGMGKSLIQMINVLLKLGVQQPLFESPRERELQPRLPPPPCPDNQNRQHAYDMSESVISRSKNLFIAKTHSEDYKRQILRKLQELCTESRSLYSDSCDTRTGIQSVWTEDEADCHKWRNSTSVPGNVTQITEYQLSVTNTYLYHSPLNKDLRSPAVWRHPHALLHIDSNLFINRGK